MRPLFLMLALQAPASAELGPAVGQAIPSFELPDQDGVARTFESLRGPRGLFLLFFRSADW